MRPRSFVAMVAIGAIFSGALLEAQGDCPSMGIDAVLADPRVQEALDAAWQDSQEGTPEEHEEGAYVYQCRNTNADGSYRYYTLVLRWPSGDVDSVASTTPHPDLTCRLVASFHTHPGPASSDSGGDGYENESPSDEDILAAYRDVIPGIIRYGSGSDVHDTTYPSGIREPSMPSWLCPSDAIDAERGESAGAHGDPHIITFAGDAYDFQAIGEFVALRVGDSREHDVQLRLEPHGNSSYVSVVTGLAMRCGGLRIEFALGGGGVRIDQKDIPVDDVVERDGVTVRSLWSGTSVTGCPQGSVFVYRTTAGLNIVLEPAASLRNKARGILGTFGNAPAGLLPRLRGESVPVPRGDSSFSDSLHTQFAADWRVPPSESLFSTPPLRPALLQNSATFPARAPRPTLRALRSSREGCLAKGVKDEPLLSHCAYDLRVTGDQAFVDSALLFSMNRRTRGESKGLQTELKGTLRLGVPQEGIVDSLQTPHEYTVRLAAGSYNFEVQQAENMRWAAMPVDRRANTIRYPHYFETMKSISPLITGLPGEFRVILSLDTVGRTGRYKFVIRPQG